MGVPHNLVESSCIGHGIPGFEHYPDMPTQGLECHLLGFIECSSSSDTAGEVWETYSEITVGVLWTTATYSTLNPPHLNLRRLCLSMERKVPTGMSRLGWGTVTMPEFVGCLKW